MKIVIQVGRRSYRVTPIPRTRPDDVKSVRLETETGFTADFCIIEKEVFCRTQARTPVELILTLFSHDAVETAFHVCDELFETYNN